MTKAIYMTQEEARDLFDYDPQLGILCWRKSKGAGGAGKIAGGPGEDGYTWIRMEGRRYRADKLAFLHKEGYYPDCPIEHLDGRKDTQVWSQMRLAPDLEPRLHPRNASGVTGVSVGRRPGTWVAQISYKGERQHLGTFNTKQEAIEARREGEKRAHR